MKLVDYIKGPIYFNASNVFTLQKYDNMINKMKTNSKYIHVDMSQELLERGNINDVFNGVQNKTILISSPDIDFPPPKKPYSYDAYFDESRLPSNYLEIDYYEKINKELLPIIEKNNLHVFVHSLSTNHPNIVNVPIGIYPKFKHFHLKNNAKVNLCYANFGIPCNRWNGNPRTYLIELLKTKSFIYSENIGTLNRTNCSQDQFYERISKSKFAICPRGCGIDTYRLWDCILLGCIPIIEKYGGHEQFHELPILYTENYSEITEDYLNEKYRAFMENDYYYDKLLENYWKNRLLE